MTDFADIVVRVLGPVDVRVDGGYVSPDRRQVRRVLSLIASTPGAVVTTDEIVEQLWARDLPRDPRRVVQGYVARIPRPTSGEPLVRSVRTGYRVLPERVDLWHYAELLRSAESLADPTEVVSVLGRARELWRGSPFAGVEGPERLASIGSKLEDTRTLHSLMLAEAKLALGEAGHALTVLQDQLPEPSSSERHALVLSEALAKLGRRTDAIAVLGEYRQTLLEQGMEPGDQIAVAERAILAGAIDVRPPPQLLVEADPTPVVGRDRLGDKLVEQGTKPGCSLLIGEAGLGKSTMLTQTQVRLEELGTPVVHLRVDSEPARPLESISQVVKALLSLGGKPESTLEMAALGRILPGEFSEADGLGQLTRDEFAEHLVGFISRSAASTRTTILLDDVQNLDPFSLAILRALIGSAAIALIGASRTLESLSLLDPNDGLDRVSVVELQPLDTADVAAYATARCRKASEPERVASLHARSGGNPLFLRLLVDLEIEGVDSVQSLPPSVVLAVRDRLDRLSQRTIDTLRVAAALGTAFSTDRLELVRPDCLPDLREASAARLIEIDSDHQGAAFVHGLVAEAVYDMTPVGRRVEMHDSIGTSLVSSGAPPTEFARHFAEAASLDPVRAIEACIAAGGEHLEGYAVEVAADFHQLGLAVANEHGLGTSRWAAETMVQLGRAQRLGSEQVYVETLVEASELAMANNESVLFAEAAIELSSHGPDTRAGSNDARTLRVIRKALDLELPEPLRAILSASVATLTSLTPDYLLGQELFGAAMDSAHRLGDSNVEAKVLANAHLGLSSPGALALRPVAAQRLLLAAGGDVDLRWEAHYLWFWHHLIQARPDDLADSLHQLRTLTPRAGHRALGLAHLEVAAAQVAGDLVRAELALEQAAALAQTVIHRSWALAHQSSLLLAIRDAQGRVTEISREVEAFVTAAPEFPNWRSAEALVAAERGDIERARVILGELSPKRFSVLFRDLTWTATVGVLGRVAAHVGDVGAAADLYQLLLPYEGLMSWAGTCSFGPNDAALAVMAETLGDETAATRHRRVAANLRERMR